MQHQPNAPTRVSRAAGGYAPRRDVQPDDAQRLVFCGQSEHAVAFGDDVARMELELFGEQLLYDSRTNGVLLACLCTAAEPSTAIGFSVVDYSMEHDGIILIDTLGVDSRRQRKGVGTALLDHTVHNCRLRLRAMAPDTGAGSVKIDAAKRWNDDEGLIYLRCSATLCDFYEQRGFRQLGQSRDAPAQRLRDVLHRGGIRPDDHPNLRVMYREA